MPDYYSLRDIDLQALLKELPTDQGAKLLQKLEPILGYWLWTESDASNVLKDALEEREIELDSEQFGELLEEFLNQSFECDATTVRVNERLSDMATDFLENYHSRTPKHQSNEPIQAQ
jgi:hypothetical protein